MSEVLTWTVARMLGKEVVLPKGVADLPHRVHRKK